MRRGSGEGEELSGWIADRGWDTDRGKRPSEGWLDGRTGLELNGLGRGPNSCMSD